MVTPTPYTKVLFEALKQVATDKYRNIVRRVQWMGIKDQTVAGRGEASNKDKARKDWNQTVRRINENAAKLNVNQGNQLPVEALKNRNQPY